MDNLAVKRNCKRKRTLAYLENVMETGNDQRDNNSSRVLCHEQISWMTLLLTKLNLFIPYMK